MIRAYAAALALLSGDLPWFEELLGAFERQAAELESSHLARFTGMFAPLADAGLSAAEREVRMRAALEETEDSGVRLFRSLALAELAAQEAACGHPLEALSTMQAAEVEARRRMDYFLLPEIVRRRGELQMSVGERDRARSTLYRSLRAARRSGAFGVELRSALSLARLLAGDGRDNAARHVLSSVLTRLPDYVDAPERREAENLLTLPLG